jgi:hypothetical protein
MLFSIKDPSLAIQLEVELQQIAVILPDVYLAGESLSAAVNKVYHINFCVFHPYLDPLQATKIALLQKQYYEDTIKNFEKKQTTPLGKIDFQPDVYLQSRGTIIGGKLNNANIHVSWINLIPEDILLCSAQYLYHFKTKTKLWKNEESYDQFNKKILHSSLWPHLFDYLSFASRTNTASLPLAIYVKDTVNFLFKIYIKHLDKGWQLDPRDKAILETYFANNDWKNYLCQSFQQEGVDQNNGETVDLIKSLRLLVDSQAQTEKNVQVEYTYVPYRKPHDNEEKAFEAIQKKFQNNLKLSEAIKTHIDFHRQDVKVKTEDPKPGTPATKKRKSTNKISQSRPVHHKQEDNVVIKTPDAQTDNTVWNTIKALIQWAYEHPMYAFTALFSIIVIMQIRPSRFNAEEKNDLCFDHFETIGGNGDFNDAKVLVILNNNTYDSDIDVSTTACLNLYKAETILQPNVPLGHKTNCGDNECIGWDSISTQRILQEKRYLFEGLAFNNVNKIYNDHAQKRALLDLQNLLKNYLIFLKNEKLLEETKHGFSEESGKTTDKYLSTIIMIKHVEFFVGKEIRSILDIEELYKQYQEQFFPIKEQQSDKDLKKRSETMCRAFKIYTSPNKKLAILADADVYNNCVKNCYPKDFGSHMILGVKNK